MAVGSTLARSEALAAVLWQLSARAAGLETE